LEAALWRATPRLEMLAGFAQTAGQLRRKADDEAVERSRGAFGLLRQRPRHALAKGREGGFERAATLADALVDTLPGSIEARRKRVAALGDLVDSCARDVIEAVAQVVAEPHEVARQCGAGRGPARPCLLALGGDRLDDRPAGLAEILGKRGAAGRPFI
jgi:hypothetical protein